MPYFGRLPPIAVDADGRPSNEEVHGAGDQANHYEPEQFGVNGVNGLQEEVQDRFEHGDSFSGKAGLNGRRDPQGAASPLTVYHT